MLQGMKPDQIFKTFFLVLTLLGLSACSMIQTHPDRIRRSAWSDEVSLNPFEDRKQNLRKEALQELGLLGMTLTEDQQEVVKRRMYLKQLERSLKTNSERSQYYFYRPLLLGDSQKIAFLRQPTLEKRERWAQRRRIDPNKKSFSPQEKQAIDTNDIILGMSKKAVEESWGEPQSIEIAGSPLFGNERWYYSDYISSPDGYLLEKKLIYFEGGRVVGWEKQ